MKNPNLKFFSCPNRVMVLASLLLTGWLASPASVHGAIDFGCIQVVKQCAYPANSPTCFPAGVPINFTGYVTNCGFGPLSGVTVVDSRALLGAGLTDLNGNPLIQPFSLAPGQVVPFKGSYAPTLTETCAGTAANTITVSATDQPPLDGISVGTLTNSTTATCAICVTPCLQVTKNCDTVVIGSANTVSGSVTNCGNIAITNIVISDNLYGTLATIPSLATGASQSYSRLVTNHTCGNFPNTVSASGTTDCGQPILAQASATCVVTESSCLGVTKTCNTVPLGQSNTLTAVVTNCGNVTLTNIVVNDLFYGSIGTIAALAPGGSATLTKLVMSSCNPPAIVPIGNLLTADGRSVCGTPVHAESSATCGVTMTPRICVTKSCNTVVIGQPNTVTAVVSNCGTVTVNGIQVADNLYGPIGTIASLSPGGTATLTKSVTNTCGNFPNTVTATGITICGQPVQAQSTATCVVTEAPCITVGKTCNTVTLGQLNTVIAVITNCGNVPLEGITVEDNLYGSMGTIGSLAPGGIATLTKAVTITACGEFTDVVTVAGRSPCNTPVQASSTNVCTVLCPQPKLCVTKEVVSYSTNGCGNNWSHLATGATSANCTCPSFCYRVRVTNCGEEALNNVTVVDNAISLAGCNFPTNLAKNQTVECIIAGVVHCEAVTNTVTVTGVGASSGIPVSTNDTAAVVVVDGVPPTITCPSDIVATNDAGQCSAVVNYTVTATDNCGGCAPLVQNFNAGPGGFTALPSPCTPPWMYASPLGSWVVGQDTLSSCINVDSAILQSPTNLVTCVGPGRLTVVHRSSLQLGPWGGGNVLVSISGSPFFPVFPADANLSAGSPTELLPPGSQYVTNVADLPSLDPGDTVVMQFVFGAGPGYEGRSESGGGVLAAWEVTSVALAVGNGGGSVTVVCEPPSGSTFPVGTNIVCCTATDAAGNTNTCCFTVTVEDREAPLVACRQGVNPSGKKIPVAGKNPASGQNPDGFYQLLGRDNCDVNPALAIYIADTGSSFIAGPFASGDVIKLTQSPGKTPSQDPAPDPIVAHIHLKGDGLIFAVDANGNVSEPELCLVPRPPK